MTEKSTLRGEETQPTQLENNDGSKLSQDALIEARSILDRAEKAKAAGDQSQIDQLNQTINDSPELSQAIKDYEERSTDLDLSKINQAQAELSDKMQRIVALSKEAFSRGAITESLFRSEEERDLVIQRITNFESEISSGEIEKIKNAISDLSNWYQRSQAVILSRLSAQSGYFGGSLPDELAVQARLFDEIESDVENLNHYLQELEKT
jgi:hypothetical protein